MAEVKKRFQRHKQVEKWNKKLTFITSDNPAAYGQFMKETSPIIPSKVPYCEKGIKEIEQIVDDIQREINIVKDSFALITHSKTNEIWPFGTEQKTYNEEQISVLTELETSSVIFDMVSLSTQKKTKLPTCHCPILPKRAIC